MDINANPTERAIIDGYANSIASNDRTGLNNAARAWSKHTSSSRTEQWDTVTVSHGDTFRDGRGSWRIVAGVHAMPDLWVAHKLPLTGSVQEMVPGRALRCQYTKAY